MSLIDGLTNEKCQICQNNYLQFDYLVPFCQKCFLVDSQKSLDLINKNILTIEEKIKEIKEAKLKIETSLKSTNLSILEKYKYNIDLINIKMLEDKLLAELRANLDSKKLNIEHTEEIKKLSNWK